ncbi:MAG TPA: pentapeptide repeat-containing protein [Pyrinomonadaceae bacterium]
MLGNEKLDVRLGGIYALERIARDSQKDHWTVMEVLTAFVRENSPDTNEYFENEAGEMQLSRSIGTKPENVKLREDIQAILTVIGRREWSETEKGRLNLMEVDLSGYVLHKANLRGANLMGAILSGTNLSETNLSDTNLMGASLVGANLYKADLSKTDLSEANLSGADLFHSNLIGAYLLAADLSQANLIRANLSGADLAEAILSRAHLSDTDLKSALNITFAQIKKAKNFEKAVLSLNLEAELKEWQAKQPAKNPIKVANGDK